MRIGASYKSTNTFHEFNEDADELIVDLLTVRVYEELIHHERFKVAIGQLVQQHKVTIHTKQFGSQLDIIDLDINLLGITMINQEPIAFKGEKK